MKKALIFAFAIILAQSLAAQNLERIGGGGTFNFGVQLVDFSAINDVTQNFGYPALDDANVSIGGGGQFYLNRFVLSGEGAFFGQSSVDSPQNNLQFGGGYGMFSLGYNVINADNLLLYPAAGVGFVGAGLAVRPRQQGTSFDDAISGEVSTNETNIGAFSEMFRLAVNMDWFPLQKDDKAYGLLIGLSAGYNFAPTSTFENPAGTALANSPEFDPSGAFITLRIGGGFYGQKK